MLLTDPVIDGIPLLKVEDPGLLGEGSMSELPATARCLVCGDGLEGKLAICPNCELHIMMIAWNIAVVAPVYGCAQIQPLDSENGDEQSTLSKQISLTCQCAYLNQSNSSILGLNL